MSEPAPPTWWASSLRKPTLWETRAQRFIRERDEERRRNREEVEYRNRSRLC